MNDSVKVGEIIEAGTGEFLAQCYQLHEPPALGCLVKTKDAEVDIYGIVCGAETKSLETGRRPIARGAEAEDETELFRNNPQLARLLSTDFRGLVVGHGRAGGMFQYLPPRPARIHSFVYLCSMEEVRAFSQGLDYLSLLVSARLTVPVDEVIAANVRSFSQVYDEPESFSVKAGKELALLLGNELGRLNAILRRLK